MRQPHSNCTKSMNCYIEIWFQMCHNYIRSFSLVAHRIWSDLMRCVWHVPYFNWNCGWAEREETQVQIWDKWYWHQPLNLIPQLPVFHVCIWNINISSYQGTMDKHRAYTARIIIFCYIVLYCNVILRIIIFCYVVLCCNVILRTSIRSDYALSRVGVFKIYNV